ncbi:MAG: hypothetical protein WBH66_00090 [Rectinemataceae bacterium]
MHKKQSNTGFSSFASAGPVYILKHDFSEGMPQVKPHVFLTLRFLLTFLILATIVGVGSWVAALRIGQIYFFLGVIGSSKWEFSTIFYYNTTRRNQWSVSIGPVCSAGEA